MRKFASAIWVAASIVLAAAPASALVSSVTEEDGSPDPYPWQVKFPNGSLTDNGDNTVSITFGAGSGDIEGVTAGNGLTGGGTSGTVTLDVVGTALEIEVGANSIGLPDDVTIGDDLTVTGDLLVDTTTLVAVAASNQVILGATSALDPFTEVPTLSLRTENTAGTSLFLQAAGTEQGARITGFHSRGTIASPTDSSSGDTMLELNGVMAADQGGGDLWAWEPVASLKFKVDGTVGVDDFPTRAEIWTTPNGSPDPIRRFHIEEDGQAVLNMTTTAQRSVMSGPVLGTGFQIQSEGGTNSDFAFFTAGLSGADADLTFNQSNGTLAARTVVTDQDILGSISMNGYDGDEYHRCLQINGMVGRYDGTAATPGNNDMPEYWVWKTCTDGSSSASDRMGLDSTGLTVEQDILLKGGDLLTGNIALRLGDATTDTITLTTDGTGDGEFVVPNDSIGVNEIGDDAILEVMLKAVDAAADEECLTYETTTGDFEWQACGGGTDTNADKEFVWPMSALLMLDAAESIGTISKDAGTNLDLLPVDFDQSTDECRTFAFLVPPDVTAGGTVTFTVVWYSASVTTNNVVWDIRHNSGVAEGVDPDQSLTVVAAAADAVQGTAGQVTFTTWTETQTNLAWAASDFVTGEVCRDANNASDTFAADARGLTFAIRIPRS